MNGKALFGKIPLIFCHHVVGGIGRMVQIVRDDTWRDMQGFQFLKCEGKKVDIIRFENNFAPRL